MVSSKNAINRIRANAKLDKMKKGKGNERIQGIYQIKANRSKGKRI